MTSTATYIHFPLRSLRFSQAESSVRGTQNTFLNIFKPPLRALYVNEVYVNVTFEKEKLKLYRNY